MNRVLAAVAFASFAASLFSRITDPMVPAIASELLVEPRTAALLGTAFALPWALMQPVLGPLGDILGKTRVITACLAVLIASAAVAAFATSFPVLLASRILAGAAAGGVSPVAMAFVGDLVPVAGRQVAFGRLIMMSISAQLLGGLVAGFLADLMGWRTIFVVVGLFNAAALLGALAVLRSVEETTRGRVRLRDLLESHRSVLRNPLTKICYGAVFLEGVTVFGIFPFIALLLSVAGETRASIAGLVVSAFGIGGMLYVASVRRLVFRFRPGELMGAGGSVAAMGLVLQATSPPWPLQMLALALMGFGFYLLHGCILVYMSELAPESRGTAVADHAFSYYLGQAVGPVVYSLGFAGVGPAATMLLAAALIGATGFGTARLLRSARV